MKSLSKSRAGRFSPSQRSAGHIAEREGVTKLTAKNREKMEVMQRNQLTHERVHALRLFTKDLKGGGALPKDGSIPVELENHFCSHVSPEVSAHLIQANDLNALDQNNPYRFWETRDRKTRDEKFNAVPKHFYTNHRTSVMRDAHQVAAAVAAGASDGGNHCQCEDAMQCDCKKAERNKLHRLDLKNQWKSRVKLGRKRSKDTRQASYEMHKPYRPCRRCCSSSHNPLFHAQRMHNEHMQRLHQSATKLMIMSVIPERPKSVDSAEDARKAFLREIDYTGSVMYTEVLRRKSIRAGLGPNVKNPYVDNISEHPEGDEEEQLTLALPGGARAKGGRQSSGLELAGQESSISIGRGPLEAENPSCYAQLEIEYLMSLLKNKSAMAQASKEQELDQTYKKARKTLKFLMAKLLLKRQFYHIDAQYKLAENEKQTAANILKLLTRCKKMSEAQNEITKILMLVHQRMDKLMVLKDTVKAIPPFVPEEWGASKRRKPAQEPQHLRTIKKLYPELVRLSSRIYIAVATLKDNEKALHRPFIFARNQYDDDWMHKTLKSLRLRILKKCPELNEAAELKVLLTKSGDVSDIRKLARSEYAKDSEAATTSSSEEDNMDAHSRGRLDRDSMDLNDKSELGRTHSQN